MKVVKVESYKQIIRDCFAEDQDLIDCWHIEAGNGLDKCVDRTFSDMENAEIEFHSVALDDDLVGYFGREVFEEALYLSGFFIRPRYRDRAHVSQFWDAVKAALAGSFYCGLYEKNLPAVEFIKKNKGELAFSGLHEGHPALIFKISEQKCQ